jgi:hypothetical protein
LIGVPIRRSSDIVVIETTNQRMTLAERGRKFILLPVNSTIMCYQDGTTIVVLDTKRKKHKFSIIHLENIPER